MSTKITVPKAVSQSTGTGRVVNGIAVGASIASAVGYGLGSISPKWAGIIMLIGHATSSVTERLTGGLSTAKVQAEESARTEGVVISKN